jgi:hypothetical protein
MSATNHGEGGNGGRGSRQGPSPIGIGGGTESVRAGVFGTDGRALAFVATPYGLSHPRVAPAPGLGRAGPR